MKNEIKNLQQIISQYRNVADNKQELLDKYKIVVSNKRKKDKMEIMKLKKQLKELKKEKERTQQNKSLIDNELNKARKVQTRYEQQHSKHI